VETTRDRAGTVAVRESDLVVVAVDGSAASVRALVWAFEEAASQGMRVGS